ncbi:MAG: response regulator [Gemmatales bacterium]|nr:response regulator [Gemmatales bacterium]MDW8385572.1 response regulator [Gemmatales bacterium]
MSSRPRILVLRHDLPGNNLPKAWSDAEFVQADSVSTALGMLQRQRFDGIYADTRGLALIEQAGFLLRADRILELLADGVVVVDPDLRIIWANPQFEKWCGGPASGKLFFEALNSPEVLGPEYSPFHTALSDGPVSTCFRLSSGRHIQFHVTPVYGPEGKLTHFIGVGRDVTDERQQQQKLDAIHQAGAELAALDPGELAKLNAEERIDLLKSNILRCAREILHYDVIELRLLDQKTGRLEPLITEGLTQEAARRVLYPLPQGNGVTGYVAATGKSYLCYDTTQDPLYLEGAAGARSSLTVPLIYHDKVIGTFNVESPKPHAFVEQDRQFLEIFCREIAYALHTLELLVAERRCSTTQSVEAISREVALPVDEILQAATGLMDRYIGHDPEMTQRLQTILSNARAIKECIQKVGESLAPAAAEESVSDAKLHRLRGLRILVADNDEKVRKSAHQILGRWGCIVETARDGREAAVMARLGNYDLMLADIRLPDMNGYEIFCQLRQARPGVPVVLMSGFGYDASHSIVKARQEGLKIVLYKPFRVDQLLDALERLALKNGNGAPAAKPVVAATTA